MADDTAETIKRFIVSSPPGEEDDVIKALSTISSSLNANLRDSSLHDLHVNTYAVVQIPDTQDRFLLTAFGEIDPTHYIDPAGARLVTFDHSTNTVVDVRNLDDSELSGHEALRKSVETAYGEYLRRHYQNGVASVYASQAENKKNAVVIAVNSTKLNLTSMWGGRWKSTWVAVFNEGKEVTINGTLEVNVHFFEKGNVHLETSDNFKLTVPWNNDKDALAAAIVARIEKEEATYQNSVDDSFLRLSETSLKHIRMQLPRSKVLINWDTFAMQGKVGAK